MKCIAAKKAGFCFGVTRALKIIFKEAESGSSIQVLGELIHNPTVLDDLKKKGIETIESLEDHDSSKTLVIRTHGIPKETELSLKSDNQQILDTTCPIVKKLHVIVSNLDERKIPVIVVGNPDHPEIVGVVSYAEDVSVINSVEEAQNIELKKHVAVVAQTTLNSSFFKEILGILVDRTDILEIYNTICDATRIRQEAIRNLAMEVDGVVVVGGKNSSNTRKLFEIAKSLNPDSFHVTGVEELKERNDFPGHLKSVGVTGGASTPPEEIDKVKSYIESINCREEGEKNG